MVGAKYGKEFNMKYEVLRISSGKDSTSGMLFEINNGKRTFLYCSCFSVYIGEYY